MIRTSLAALTCLLLFCGCSDDAEKTYPVTGTVTLDGQPLPEGNIQFVPLDGKHGAEPGVIKDGKFELSAIQGQKRVEISAAKIIPGSSLRGAGGEPVPEEYLPQRYNASSELTADVKPQENVIDFPLVSKK